MHVLLEVGLSSMTIKLRVCPMGRCSSFLCCAKSSRTHYAVCAKLWEQVRRCGKGWIALDNEVLEQDIRQSFDDKSLLKGTDNYFLSKACR